MGVGRFLSKLVGHARVLAGADRPTLPAGAHAFVSQEDVYGSSWRIRYAMQGEDPTPDRPLVLGSPPFTSQIYAYRYLDWVNGGPPFEYPPGAV